MNVVYGRSAFVAALGSTHDRVTDERATPLLRHLYAGGYLGRAHFLRLQQQHRDVQANPALLREFQELLVGDPFADAECFPSMVVAMVVRPTCLMSGAW